ncbi:hypothetical protein SNOG_13990 [Parastagonospora nodorum SN15]|uniref:Uncharacterized protein n=1 Tax=Phaeosphaeria nodorum (strain SN15 / ATCC MYA-4574 / FGSC 10173) TaxID=321614 RepID=Q0U2W1_PHANO|nr:hypothetical protein SNOG_13990 [Parastagonospora nodorum SN15]EAT78615.1 hypothetical protein SNOG_13990 [Parastagonospora nodorum SN15]
MAQSDSPSREHPQIDRPRSPKVLHQQVQSNSPVNPELQQNQVPDNKPVASEVSLIWTYPSTCHSPFSISNQRSNERATLSFSEAYGLATGRKVLLLSEFN